MPVISDTDVGSDTADESRKGFRSVQPATRSSLRRVNGKEPPRIVDWRILYYLLGKLQTQRPPLNQRLSEDPHTFHVRKTNEIPTVCVRYLVGMHWDTAGIGVHTGENHSRR